MAKPACNLYPKSRRMKLSRNQTVWVKLLFTLAATMFTAAAFGADSPREHLLLDANWRFHLGDDWPGALHLDKAGASTGPAAEKFNDQSWRVLNLPHDWAIELPFDKNADASHGFKPLGPSFHKNSIGWYRRGFELPATDSGKRIWLTFDGVFRDATVWVNGWLIKRHEGGYYPFREDITDVVHLGGKNIIAVRVDASKFEGWFYEGAGIYRHVWLDKTAPVAIASDGIFVSTQFEKGGYSMPEGMVAVLVKTTVKNSGTDSTQVTASQELIRPDGKTAALNQQMTTALQGLASSPEEDVDANSTKEITSAFFFPDAGKPPEKQFENAGEFISATLGSHSGGSNAKFKIVNDPPVLWSPETPKLYKLVTTVSVGDKIIDQKETEFGIRTVAFDPNNGFLLNGRHYELQGTCNHQDMAGVGVALPDALQTFRVLKLKEFGCNAIRTSHNPPTPELLDACDHLGMLVMDESRLLGSDSENLRKWDDQICRDRNHACVAIWSIGNEEFSVQSTPQGGNVARTMQDHVQRLDPTRPVTYAAPQGDTFEGINGVIQVRGWNYHVGQEMDSYHAKHPDQPEVGTEQASTVSTRGIYANDMERGYVSAYDDNAPSWATTTERWWSYFADRRWLSGGFVWTGFDYRGEPTPYAWPCINSHFGILDTCGFSKDNFYYYQSWWTTNVVLHLMPHWNWPGKEGQEIRVDALSNCKQVELFLNGQSLGRQAMKPNSKLSWKVKYAPGTLSAKGFDVGGSVVKETKVETTGDAVAIQLKPDRSTLNANDEDVSVFTVSAVDAQGRTVPVAQNKIHFTIEGLGRILGVGNGDPSCHEPDTYIPNIPVHTIAVNDWHWKIAEVPNHPQILPEYANDFDDSSWNTIKPKTDGDTGDMFLKDGQDAIYRAHMRITGEDLASESARVCFSCIDDHGRVYVNNQFVGKSDDWAAQPAFDVKKALHVGDNIIAVAVLNDSGPGGLNPDVNVELVGKPISTVWSRSLFNGFAQVMVQSSLEPGEIKLTASADGLQPATTTIQTVAGGVRPRMP